MTVRHLSFQVKAHAGLGGGGESAYYNTGLFRHLRLVWQVTSVTGTNPVMYIEVRASLGNARQAVLVTSYDIIIASSGVLLVEQLPDVWNVKWWISGDTPVYAFVIHAYLTD